MVVGAAEATANETRLAALTAGVLARTGDGAPSKSQRLVLGQIRDAHLDHLQALGAPDPTQPGAAGAIPLPSPSPSPAPTRSGAETETETDDAIAALIEQEQGAAAGYRQRVTVAQGDLALFWASLAVADAGYARALGSEKSRSATPLGRQRGTLTALTEAEAMTQLLAQTNAALYGYEAALARLSGAEARSAAKRITSFYRLRDILSATIIEAGGRPSSAAPVYLLDPKPTTVTSAHRLMAAVETRMQPYLGQWVRTSGGPNRTSAVSALSGSVSTGLDWGAPLDRWPGWPSAR